MASELDLMKLRIALQGRLDEQVEVAERRRLSLRATLELCLPLIREACSAREVWVETPDDQLQVQVYGDQPQAEVLGLARSAPRASGGGGQATHAGGRVHGRVLDVAGEDLGTLALQMPPEPGAEAPPPEEIDALLHTAAEVLDNYVASRRRARQKQRLLLKIHEALRNPVVGEGVRLAVDELDETVHFDLLIVLYHLEEDYQDSLHYLVFRGKELQFATRQRVASELDALLSRHGGQHPGGEILIRNAEVEHRRIVGEDLVPLDLEGESEELLRRLGYEDFLETLLIGGFQEEASVGKLVVGSKRPLTTYEQDVFDLFADVLQKRIVDYGRAGRDLHRTFPLPTVVRLLDQPDYRSLLAPCAAELSILYADVSGFTRLSEQILKDPAEVGALIEAFSREAVRLMWKQGGVFDKLVGDCVIGLFGPPYYEQSAAERALACARAAAEISRFAREELCKLPATEKVVAAGEPLGVAIGINDCPASVGVFGPNRDFTAFSPGMNNTARLQSVAVRDEVLVLAPMRALIEEACPEARFGELRHEKVKNVAEPLAFYALDCASVL
jgi:adenylate cyclase